MMKMSISQQIRFRETFAMRSKWRSALTAIGALDSRSRKINYQRRPIAISLVCDLVEQYEDPLRTDFWNRLTSLAPRSEEPPAGHSFASGARFLQKQIRNKLRRFDLMDRSK